MPNVSFLFLSSRSSSVSLPSINGHSGSDNSSSSSKRPSSDGKRKTSNAKQKVQQVSSDDWVRLLPESLWIDLISYVYMYNVDRNAWSTLFSLSLSNCLNFTKFDWLIDRSINQSINKSTNLLVSTCRSVMVRWLVGVWLFDWFLWNCPEEDNNKLTETQFFKSKFLTSEESWNKNS